MEQEDIFRIWQSYDRKLDEVLQINRRQAADITTLKVRSLLGSMQPAKLFTLVTGILWVIVIGTVLIHLTRYALPQVSLFFLVSAGLQILLTATALFVYIYQLVLIRQVDIAQPILETQRRLTQLRSSTLWVTRILFLQLPLWTTFYISEDMLHNGSILFYGIQGGVTLAFTIAAFWLFGNIRYENRDKRWFRLIFGGREWTPLMQSLSLLEQLEGYAAEHDSSR